MNELRQAELGEIPKSVLSQAQPQDFGVATADNSGQNATSKRMAPPDSSQVTGNAWFSTLGLSRLAAYFSSTRKENSLVECEDVLPGLPLIAHRHSCFDNTAMYPKYDELAARVLLDQQLKLGVLWQMLHHEDVANQEADSARPGSFTFQQEWLIQQPTSIGVSHDPTAFPSTFEQSQHHNYLAQYRRNNILEILFSRLKAYYDFIDVNTRINSKNKVSDNSFENRREFLEPDIPKGSDVWRMLFDEKGDFITTRTSPGPFERLLLSKNLPFMKKLFRWLFPWKGETIGPSGNYHIDTDSLNAFKRFLFGVSWCIVQLMPVVILFVVSLSQAGSLTVVAVFSAFLVITMCYIGVELDGVVLSSCAYIAVLVVFLANLQQN